jgi:hypothetical protein
VGWVSRKDKYSNCFVWVVIPGSLKCDRVIPHRYRVIIYSVPKISDRDLGDGSISFSRMVKKLWDGCPGRINIVITLFGLSPLGL